MLFVGTTAKFQADYFLSCVICHSCALRKGFTAKVAPCEGSDELNTETDALLAISTLAPREGSDRKTNQISSLPLWQSAESRLNAAAKS